MKKLIFVFLFLGGILAFMTNHTAHAALLFVSTSTASSTVSGVTTTASMTTTAGNLLVTYCLETGGGSDFSTATATSSDLTTFTQFAVVSGTSFGQMQGFYGIASTTGANTISCVYSGASLDRAQSVFQYSGNATTNVLDTSSTFLTNTAVTSSTITFSTTNANDVITGSGYANSDGAITSIGSPFTTRFLKTGLFSLAGGDLITSTVQTNQTYKWTFASSPFANITASFKAAAAVTAAPTMTFAWNNDD